MNAMSHGMEKGPAGRKIAVIGAGVAGLSASWLLSQRHRVTLYEAESRPGGHANTVSVDTAEGPVPVDTGFIVYNERNYPNLTAFFKELGVETQVSDMSFAASIDDGALEYSSLNINTLVGQRSNMLKPRFWRMVGDILRFYREAPLLLAQPVADHAHRTLGDYLDANGYADCFVEDHLLPMGAAIWSTTASQMREYPLLAFIRFFTSHGLLTILDRPIWRTVTGGSRQYVQKLMAQLTDVRLGHGAVRVERRPEGVLVTDTTGHTDLFEDVVIATHANQALAMLAHPSAEEMTLLGAFRYVDNRAVLHSDSTIMPRRRRVWASWNYVGDKVMAEQHQLCVTYWMNRLQSLKTKTPLFVTLNPSRPITPDKVIQSFDYRHPLFDRAAITAQQHLWQLQGRDRVWFCGSYFGHGFHEDALQAGLHAAELAGGVRRPWTVQGESDRIVCQPAVAAE